jgi:hypothetical protein
MPESNRKQAARYGLCLAATKRSIIKIPILYPIYRMSKK